MSYAEAYDILYDHLKGICQKNMGFCPTTQQVKDIISEIEAAIPVVTETGVKPKYSVVNKTRNQSIHFDSIQSLIEEANKTAQVECDTQDWHSDDDINFDIDFSLCKKTAQKV